MLAPLVGGIILARLSAGPGTVSGMTAQLAGEAGTGPHEVIHLGGEAAVVVPVAEYRRLRALEQLASPHELEGADDTAGMRAMVARLDALAEAPRPAESFRWGDILRLRVGRYRISCVAESSTLS